MGLVVQSVTGNGPTLQLTGVAPGNSLICIASTFRAPSTGIAAATPTDSNGTFSIASADTPSTFTSGTTDDCGIGIWYQANVAGGTHTVTPEALNGFDATLLEISGLVVPGLFDVAKSAVTNNGSQTSQVTGTTAVTAQAEVLVIIGLALAAAGGVANVGLTNPVSGFTILHINQNDSTGIACLHAYKFISAIGAQSATFNWTDSEANQASHGAVAVFRVQPTVGHPVMITSNHPGRSPGKAPASFRFWTPPNVGAVATPTVTTINESIGPFTWAGSQSNLTKILTEGVGAWTWAGTTAAVPRLVAAVPGPYTWTGKTSPISKSIASLKGLYLWAGTGNTLARSLAPAPASYTWAGVHATLGAPINETVGTWSWAGRQSTFVMLIQEAIGRWTWAGTHSNVTVPGAVSATHLYPIPGRRTRR